MTIEFHAPAGEVQEELIKDIKIKLAKFHALDNDIARAEVDFRLLPDTVKGQFECEIVLTIFGGSITVQRHADTYAIAAEEVLEELTAKVQEQMDRRNEPPTDIFTSVEVE